MCFLKCVEGTFFIFGSPSKSDYLSPTYHLWLSLKKRLLITCCKSATGQARTINTDDKEPIRQQMNEKMEAAESKEIYKQRKVIVEPVFGQIKNIGFRGFSVRGKTKTSGEFSLVCAVHNIKKITKAIFKGVVCSEFGKLVPIQG
ncbi:MAG: transposase [Desulfocapsa sp.]|nr:transposase [Desulfocapsa sp.]